MVWAPEPLNVTVDDPAVNVPPELDQLPLQLILEAPAVKAPPVIDREPIDSTCPLESNVPSAMVSAPDTVREYVFDIVTALPV